ncbi:MAG: hypothetical protein E4H27_02920 [Anaerolineales bacterium]|nr:MAG: hypothetical protein E4H27_02920 [Anaerolineales bacterium]
MMTEDPYYTLNPEEETTPRRNNSKLFIGLIVGLLIGGVVGYTLGGQNLGGLPAVDSRAAPPFFISINVTIIFVLFVFLLVTRLRRSGAVPYQGDIAAKKIILLMVGLMALLAAGIYVFFAS